MIFRKKCVQAYNASKYGSMGRHMQFLLVAAVTIVALIYLSVTDSRWKHVSNLSHKITHPNKHNGHLASETDMYDEQARVGKVSMLYGDSNPVYERALQTHKVHNRIHGYPFFIQRESILDGYWTKPAHLQAVVLNELEKPSHRRLKWLFWVDADTVLLNYQTALESFLPPEGDEILTDVKILVTEDWNGLNNGVFAIRVDKYAVELFAGILSFRDFRQNETLSFQDQSAMEMILQQRKFAKHNVVVPQRWLNAYKSNEDGGELRDDQVRPGDLLVHFAGVGGREGYMTEWCELSEKRNATWDKRLSETQYPAEIRKFWEDVKKKKRNIGQRMSDATRRLKDVCNAAKLVFEEQKTKVTEKNLKSLQEVLQKGERIRKLHERLEEKELTEEDIRVFESSISEIHRASINTKIS